MPCALASGLAIPPVLLVDSRSSTCCESFGAHTCMDLGGQSCRFIRLYEGNMHAEREGCAPESREGLHLLSAHSRVRAAYQRFGPAKITQSEDLNLRRSSSGTYQLSPGPHAPRLVEQQSRRCESSSGQVLLRSARTCQTACSSNQALRCTSVVELKRW